MRQTRRRVWGVVSCRRQPAADGAPQPSMDFGYTDAAGHVFMLPGRVGLSMRPPLGLATKVAARPAMRQQTAATASPVLSSAIAASGSRPSSDYSRVPPATVGYLYVFTFLFVLHTQNHGTPPPLLTESPLSLLVSHSTSNHFAARSHTPTGTPDAHTHITSPSSPTPPLTQCPRRCPWTGCKGTTGFQRKCNLSVRNVVRGWIRMCL